MAGNKAKLSQLDICKKVESHIRRNGIPKYIRAMTSFDQQNADLPPAQFMSALKKFVKDYHSHSRLIISNTETDTPPEHEKPLTKMQMHKKLLMDDPTFQRPEPTLSFSKNVLTIVLGRFLTHIKTARPTLVRSDWDRHVRNVRSAINRARKTGAGIILDLRNHSGGNFQPVVDMFQDLFMNTTLFSWCNDPPSRFSQQWITQDPGHSEANLWMPAHASYAGSLTSGRYRSGQFNYPCIVAVIIGSGTASSGEIAAAIFVGKTGARLFGQKTAGALSVNQGTAIAPGLELNLTQLLVATTDRVMHFDECLTPDVKTRHP